MNIKLYILLLMSFVFTSCVAQKTRPDRDEWEKIGSASIENGQFKVDLGTTYNVLQTEQYGEIHLKHKYIDSLNIQKVSSNRFKATYRKAKGFSIEVSHLKIHEQDASADFIFNFPNNSLPSNSLKIILEKQSMPPQKTKVIKSYFLPVIHDYLAYIHIKLRPNSCIAKAIKACGKGNVQFIDINIFGSGCSFKCK